MTTNIFHILPIGKGYNIGNFAISYAVRAWIKKIHPESNIITIPAIGIGEQFGLSKRIIYQANQFASSVIVGGGNLFENNELFVDVNALESLQIPLVLFSISRGDIYNNKLELARRTDVIPDSVLISLHRRAVFSLARDQATYEYLKKIGISNSQMGGCPTIFMDKWFQPSTVPSIAHLSNYSFISIRNPEQMNIPLQLQFKIPKLVKDLMGLLKDTGYGDVSLLCHDQRDLSFASSIGGVPYTYTSDVNDYLWLIKNAKLIVSMRMHSSLPCAALQTPFINLSYDERGLSLMKSINMGAWDINLVKSPNVIEEVAERLSDLGALPKLIVECQVYWQQLYDIQYNAISRLVS